MIMTYRASVIWMGLAIFSLGACSGGGGESPPPPPPAPQNAAPVITSASSVEVLENSSDGYRIEADDPDGDALTYSIVGGEDAALFVIEGDPDFVTFLNPPNFEIPEDSDQDNVYEVQLEASDGQASAQILVSVNVLDVDELPAGVTSVAIQTNANDRLFSEIELEDGAVFRAEGDRDAEGLPQRITALSARVPSPDAPDGAFDINYVLDQEGLVTRLIIEGVGSLGISYNSEGEAATISALTQDGSGEVLLAIEDFSEQPSTASSTRHPDLNPEDRASLRDLVQLLNWQAQDLAARRGEEVEAFASSLAPDLYASPEMSGASTSQSSPGVKEVTVEVLRCGVGVPDAGVDVAATLPDGSTVTRRATHQGGGVYATSFAIERVELGFDEACSGAFSIPNTYCTWINPAINPATITSGCTALAGALEFATVIVPGDFALWFGACTGSLGGLQVYCGTLGLSPAPGAPSVSDGLCLGGEILAEQVWPDGEVTSQARATVPQSGSFTSAAVTNEPLDSTSLLVQTDDELSIDRFFTSPVDPAPSQSYTATAELSCVEQTTQVNMSISGTDGYQGASSCTLSDDGSCNLNVPGAAAGVQDRIRVEAADKARTIFITF